MIRDSLRFAPIALVILAGACSGDSHEPAWRLDPLFSVRSECPTWMLAGYEASPEECRKLSAAEHQAIMDQFRQFADVPDMGFRWEVRECAEIGQHLNEWISKTYWIHPDRSEGRNDFWEVNGVGVAISLWGGLFMDLEHGDPRKNERFRVMTHELAHAAGLGHAEDNPGDPVHAESAAQYCTRNSEFNPWTASQGGGDGGAPGGCYSVYLDHYWYELGTGAITYRGTELIARVCVGGPNQQ